MKAYVIAAETVNDLAVFDLYRKEVPATLVPFGGQFVARGGNLTVLEGEWPHASLSSPHALPRKTGTNQRSIER
jgi:uncharacterized protein (DUF1330 family)